MTFFKIRLDHFEVSSDIPNPRPRSRPSPARTAPAPRRAKPLLPARTGTIPPPPRSSFPNSNPGLGAAAAPQTQTPPHGARSRTDTPHTRPFPPPASRKPRPPPPPRPPRRGHPAPAESPSPQGGRAAPGPRGGSARNSRGARAARAAPGPQADSPPRRAGGSPQGEGPTEAPPQTYPSPTTTHLMACIGAAPQRRVLLLSGAGRGGPRKKEAGGGLRTRSRPPPPCAWERGRGSGHHPGRGEGGLRGNRKRPLHSHPAGLRSAPAAPPSGLRGATPPWRAAASAALGCLRRGGKASGWRRARSAPLGPAHRGGAAAMLVLLTRAAHGAVPRLLRLGTRGPRGILFSFSQAEPCCRVTSRAGTAGTSGWLGERGGQRAGRGGPRARWRGSCRLQPAAGAGRHRTGDIPAWRPRCHVVTNTPQTKSCLLTPRCIPSFTSNTANTVLAPIMHQSASSQLPKRLNVKLVCPPDGLSGCNSSDQRQPATFLRCRCGCRRFPRPWDGPSRSAQRGALTDPAPPSLPVACCNIR